jgi:hypothetical protein
MCGPGDKGFSWTRKNCGGGGSSAASAQQASAPASTTVVQGRINLALRSLLGYSTDRPRRVHGSVKLITAFLP